MNKKSLIAILLIIALSITGYIIWKNKKVSTDDNFVKIGVMLPLTGEGADWGNNAKNAIELAIEEINKKNKKYKYEFIFEDSHTDSKIAVTTFTKLVDIDKVKYCIVDMISSNVLAIAPIANAKKVLILSPGASNPKITHAGDYVFRNWPSDALQGEIDAHVASDTLKWKNIAILKINNDYGVGLAEVFIKNLNPLSKIVTSESYEKGATNFKTQLLKIKNSNADGVYLLSYPEELPIIFKQAKELNLNKVFLGTETFESQQLIDAVGNIADGAVYTFPKTPDSSVKIVGDFRRNYMAKFGKPWGTPGDAAYDAVYMFVNSIEKSGNDVEKIKQAFYDFKNYQGVSGLVSIDKNGDGIKSFDLKTIKNKSFIKYVE